MQNSVGVKSFSNKRLLDKRGVLLLGIPVFIGAILGAQIAIKLDEEVLKLFIGGIMLMMLVIILIRPKKWLMGELQSIEGRPSPLILVVFFLIGIYGGFIQAGVGIFLLSGLVLGVGYDLVRANAVKVGIILLFTIAALVVFILEGQVDWGLGLVLGVGNMGGAWVATRFAAEKGAIWVRRLLIVMVSVSAYLLLDLEQVISNIF